MATIPTSAAAGAGSAGAAGGAGGAGGAGAGGGFGDYMQLAKQFGNMQGQGGGGNAQQESGWSKLAKAQSNSFLNYINATNDANLVSGIVNDKPEQMPVTVTSEQSAPSVDMSNMMKYVNAAKEQAEERQRLQQEAEEKKRQQQAQPPAAQPQAQQPPSNTTI